jgi:hypothetical protein
MEAVLRFAGPENCETKIFGRLSAWQNWIFQRPNAVGEHGALTSTASPERLPPPSTGGPATMSTVDLGAKIPNNVDLRDDKRCSARSRSGSRSSSTGGRRWAPRASRQDDVYLRTAVSVGRRLGALRLREDARLPLGHLPRRRSPTRSIGFGDHIGQPVWQEVPGEYRNACAASS